MRHVPDAGVVTLTQSALRVTASNNLRDALVAPRPKSAQGGLRACSKGPLTCPLAKFALSICNGSNTSTHEVAARRVRSLGVGIPASGSKSEFQLRECPAVRTKSEQFLGDQRNPWYSTLHQPIRRRWRHEYDRRTRLRLWLQ